MCSPYIWSPLAVATPRVFNPPGRLRIIVGLRSILKKVNPCFLRRGHAGGIYFGIAAFGGIAIAANAIAVLGADQPPGRHAVHLPGDVVQGDIQRAVAAAEPALAGEIANAVQNGLDVQRVLAHDVRLEHERHAFVARITDLAEAVHALVGVDPDDRIIVVRGDADGPHVGDPQLARCGVLVYAARPEVAGR